LRCHSRTFFLFAAGVLSHLGPNEEMPHRHLDHVKAIEHLIDMLRADVLLFSASLFR
jgi:hypothetical protein